MIALCLATMAVCAISAAVTVVFALIADTRSHEAGEYARQAAAFKRRDTEQHSADDALEVDRGRIAPTRPLRLVHLHEHHERLRIPAQQSR